MTTKNIIIIRSVAALILLLCLFPMPYGFYTLARFVMMVFFAIFAYLHYSKNETSMLIIFASLAIMFQPFVKLALGRVVWNIVDVLVALFLLILVIKDLRTSRK